MFLPRLLFDDERDLLRECFVLDVIRDRDLDRVVSRLFEVRDTQRDVEDGQCHLGRLRHERPVFGLTSLLPVFEERDLKRQIGLLTGETIVGRR